MLIDSVCVQLGFARQLLSASLLIGGPLLGFLVSVRTALNGNDLGMMDQSVNRKLIMNHILVSLC